MNKRDECWRQAGINETLQWKVLAFLAKNLKEQEEENNGDTIKNGNG